MKSRSFTKTDPQSHQGDNTWFTPREIIDRLEPFDVDVCTVSWRPYDTAKRHIEHDKGQDALEVEWDGFVWMNPPYGKEIDPFIEKFLEHGDGIGLVFARMGTKWMHEFLSQGDAVFFLRKRIKFINRNMEVSSNAGCDSCLLLMGEKAIRCVKNCGLDGKLICIKG